MRRRWLLIISLTQFVILFSAMSFSYNGLIDLYRLQTEIRETDEEIAIIEDQNREYRRKLDLLEKQYHLSIEDFARREMGYVQTGERIYLYPQQN